MNFPLTLESKEKGDEGLYAAIDAANLARALRGATLSRLLFLQKAKLTTITRDLILGVAPRRFELNPTDVINREAMFEISGGDAVVSHYDNQPSVGIPDASFLEELKLLLPFIQRVSPGMAMDYESYMKLMHVLNLPEAGGITTLDITESANPQEEPAPSDAILASKMKELTERYPLPVSEVGASKTAGNEEEEEEEEESVEDLEAKKHNAELKSRCEKLQLECPSYKAAIAAMASHEMKVFPLLCHYLCGDRKLKVLIMSRNAIGAEKKSDPGRVDLIPIRALARLIDANESLKVLDLSYNEFRPNTIGILAKALTKNISLMSVDLSGNDLHKESLDDIEDPEHEEDDPVFGEYYSGLEAISEVLKKNKFIRCLRLSQSHIHAGEDLLEETNPITGPEEDLADFDPQKDFADTDVQEEWTDLPLWKLVSPLMKFHRLEVLDLSGNMLKIKGTRMLASALSVNRSVKVLDLSDNAIGFKGLHYLANLVLSNPESALRTLVLRRNEICGKKTSKSQQKMALAAMKAVAHSLENNKTLKCLILSDNHLGSVLSSAMLETIGTAEALEELDLGCNEICGDHPSLFDPTAARCIAKALFPEGRTSTLAKLRLGANNLLPVGASILFPSHQAPPAALKELDLSRNALGNDLTSIGELLSKSAVLRKLILTFNDITNPLALLPGIAQNQTLFTLDLGNNKLGAETIGSEVSQLFLSLARHPKVENLNFSSNDLTNSQGTSLVQSFGRLGASPSLRRLDIRGNPAIPLDVIQSLLQYLGAKDGMEVLYLPTIPEITPEAQSTLLQLTDQVVSQSASLLDISNGLKGKANLLEEEKDSINGAAIGSMRRRLLLNALKAGMAQ